MHVGIPEIADLNAPPFEGVSYQQFTIRNGRRETSYTAFVKPVRGRKNLTVETDVRVLRIVIENGEATGVEVLQKGKKRVIAAAREVIVSAGALASPHLLMLSGIGEARNLQALGIDAPGRSARRRAEPAGSLGCAVRWRASSRTAPTTGTFAAFGSTWRARATCCRAAGSLRWGPRP